MPNLDVGSDFEVCIDDTIQVLTPNIAGGTWTGNGITDPTKDFSPTVAGPGIHELIYYYKDSSTFFFTSELRNINFSVGFKSTKPKSMCIFSNIS